MGFSGPSANIEKDTNDENVKREDAYLVKGSAWKRGDSVFKFDYSAPFGDAMEDRWFHVGGQQDDPIHGVAKRRLVLMRSDYVICGLSFRELKTCNKLYIGLRWSDTGYELFGENDDPLVCFSFLNLL